MACRPHKGSAPDFMGILVPKKIKFESFKYRFLVAAQTLTRDCSQDVQAVLTHFTNQLEFSYDAGNVVVAWQKPERGSASFELRGGGVSFYVRGDTQSFTQKQHALACADAPDPVKLKNSEIFADLVTKVWNKAGLKY